MYWDLYDDQDIDLPAVPKLPLDGLDVHSRGIRECHKIDRTTITEAETRYHLPY
jgi:choline-sulfatase